MELQELVEKARHTKVRKKLLDLEIYRAAKTLADAGATPHDFAHGLGISKYELPDMLKKAERVEPVPIKKILINSPFKADHSTHGDKQLNQQVNCHCVV